ncbi:hypothetical protein L6V77_12260 [Myxococcota bacterium]|nr:hypothetical protein [Myxococcota bacterium]
MNRMHGTALLLALALAACGTETAHAPVAGSTSAPPVGPAGEAAAPLTLSPQVELVGLADVYDDLLVTDVHFEADLYLLPEGDDEAAGDAVAIAFDLVDGVPATLVPDGALTLAAPGRYRLLVRVRPDARGTSVEVTGGYVGQLARGKADDEPTPTPAEPTPTPAEPTPTPANPGDEPGEPTPTPAEPTPTPAEPTPTPAEPTPTPARGKAESGAEAAEQVYVRSTRAYEFFAGTVEIAPDAEVLVVTWDVRTWFRALLAQPLGISAEEQAAAAPTATTQGGFFDQATDFRVIAR